MYMLILIWKETRLKGIILFGTVSSREWQNSTPMVDSAG